MFLCNAIGNMCSDGTHLCRSLYVKHLIIEVDVWPYLLKHRALWCSCKEQGLIDLQPPGPKCLESPNPRTCCTTSCDQVGADRAVQTLAFSVKLFLELPQCL